MAQRRNASSSGKGDGPSDLDDTKALAAKARSQTGGPVLVPNAAELSGVRPRRDSVIGARLTPPPRTTGAEMPNWVWGVLGCLTVLLVGSVGLFVLMRSGKLNALVGESAPVVAVAPQAAAPDPAPAPAPVEEPAVAAPPSRPARAPAARVAADEPAPTRAPAADPEPAAAVAAPSEEAKRGPQRERPSSKAVKAADEAAAPAPTAGEGEGEAAAAPAAEAKAPSRPARPAAAAAKPAAEKPVAEKPAAEAEAEDDQTPAGQDAVEAALDALATRVRGCFVKYQIKGTARVRLVATPGGTAESVSVTGEFEDTPTGLCVESVVASAKLPTFKGGPLKLSQSYQLR